MKLDLLPFEAWENLNAQVGAAISVEPSIEARVYRGLGAAVFEMALGMVQFFSHKRSVGLIPGRTPYGRALLPYLYKEGYEVQLLRENQDIKTFVDSLKKDTNFVISCEDHPITAQIYETELLDQLLNEKKIFHLQISHHLHLFRKREIRSYSARICSFDPQCAVALLGAKIKSPPLIAQTMAWNASESQHLIQMAMQGSQEDVTVVKKIESSLPSGFKALLNTEERIFDRALIYSEQLGGEAVQQFLASQLHMEIRKPSLETQIETTHQCRWGGIQTEESWWQASPPSDVLRGLLILGLETLRKPGLKAALERAHQECRIV